MDYIKTDLEKHFKDYFTKFTKYNFEKGDIRGVFQWTFKQIDTIKSLC